MNIIFGRFPTPREKAMAGLGRCTERQEISPSAECDGVELYVIVHLFYGRTRSLYTSVIALAGSGEARATCCVP
jgi:hypothetical protein